MKKFWKRHFRKYSNKKILGVILVLIGILIIAKVIPMSFWLFLIGFVIMIFGIYLIKCG
ncbi:hypothetical protein [Sporanaerobacter acetigenes]|uniref:hypothetical protein n=1 Tax=Sporanaerobacter acetigenes TaxID=165813 RepID=UPI001304ADE4|nr:hypothetical protein [Sporanaerobacter acetigenes]